MPVALLAGGLGSRLSEETETKPKPMVEIGGRPVLWHIMKYYSHFGFRRFNVALGYRGEYIKRWFSEYASLATDLTVHTKAGLVVPLHNGNGDEVEDWEVSLVDTGRLTGTGGRIKRIGEMLDRPFMLTWGDGLSTVDLHGLLRFHQGHGKHVTLTAVRPPARFGHIELDGDHIVEFSEKVQTKEGWINGAFFVVNPEALDYIDGDNTSWERDPLEQLAADGELMAYRHEGFWQCMDTRRDRNVLEKIWQTDDIPWKVW
ncbi:MAG: glucose-1-phosphate cytidylyltransferase [Actinomycetota bacterium]|nr:glucose-1-phosphate cytidylyltransferase [Actinomycetota bacterium]